VDEPTDRAWWYRRDEADEDGGGRADGVTRATTPPASAPPSLPGPNRPPPAPADQDTPSPGVAAPGRHGWARSDATYVPSVTDKGATKSIVLGVIGLLLCGVILGPAAIVEGVNARRRIAASGGGLSGNAQAIVGICVGALATFLAALGILAIVIEAMVA
jgi:hypothetical protein